MTIEDLKEQITIEFYSLEIVVGTLLELKNDVQNRTLSLVERAAVFSIILQLYSGIENILKSNSSDILKLVKSLKINISKRDRQAVLSYK